MVKMFRVLELLEIYYHYPYCFCSFIIVFNSSTLEGIIYDKNNTHDNNTKLIALYKMVLFFSISLLTLDF